MALASLALLAVVVAGTALALTVREFLAVREQLAEAERSERRYRSWAIERRRFMATRSSIADAAQMGSSITRAPGRLIRKVAPPASERPSPPDPD